MGLNDLALIALAHGTGYKQTLHILANRHPPKRNTLCALTLLCPLPVPECLPPPFGAGCPLP